MTVHIRVPGTPFFLHASRNLLFWCLKLIRLARRLFSSSLVQVCSSLVQALFKLSFKFPTIIRNPFVFVTV